MPQIAQIAATYASQAFWLLIVFGLIYFVIARGAVTRVGKTIDLRAAKVSGDLAAAQSARDAAMAAEQDYDFRTLRVRTDAAKLLAAAKTASAASTAGSVATVDAELDSKIDAAIGQIAAATDAAMVGVRDAAIDAAGEIVVRLTGKAADAKLLAAAVDSAGR
jgi:F-type H+-transporting ATPase subunit b